MSKLGDQLARQLPPTPQPPSTLGMLADLRAHFHTVTKAAAEAGIGRRTWQNIESGASRRPSRRSAERIESAWRATQPRAVETLHVEFLYDGRTRHVGEGALKLAAGTRERVQAALDAGDRDQAAAEFLDGVRDTWYHDRLEYAHLADLEEVDAEDLDDYNGGLAA